MQKRKRRRATSKPQSGFKLVNKITEDHGQPIYSVQFNFADFRHKDMFATVGSRRATTYRILPTGEVVALQAYMDDNKQEELYTCAWSYDPSSGAPWLVTAGQLGIIKVINCNSRKVERSLLGHVNAINELRLHPINPQILLSASKDQSVRLWSLMTGRCVAIFAGENGHRDEVLSADFHLSGELLVSSSMDHTIKVWDLTQIKDLVDKSHKPRAPGEPRTPVKYVQFPLFSTSKVHNNYVDCVRFLGDFILSKSTEESIILWSGRYPNEIAMTRMPNQSVRRLNEYKFTDCSIWYVRFGMDFGQTQLAVGNKSGGLFVWNIDERETQPEKLINNQLNSVMRQVAFDFDGNLLVGVCDNATMWVWKKVDRDAGHSKTKFADRQDGKDSKITQQSASSRDKS